MKPSPGIPQDSNWPLPVEMFNSSTRISITTPRPVPMNISALSFQLARVCEENAIRDFNCFPFHRSWSPYYKEIDTKILCYHILECKMESYIKSKRFQCRGTIHTDGVGVTVFKKTNDLQSGFGQRFGIQKEEIK
ncbi:hypothetical protein BX666DRAFT_2153682 [Dichotomocladium elegans]|nr:hypothetical protein BX666DRAFT_2153682 [Dichotomocladium elegans]